MTLYLMKKRGLTIAQVDPITGYIDSSFNFTVIFTDPDDQPPDAITVNITGFGVYDLMQSDPLDIVYSDGKEYYFDLAGFSIGQYPFHFAANDSITIFFVLLSYHLWKKGHEQLSILSLVFGAATKFYPLFK